MPLLLAWTRIELRRRWRPLVVLALLVAVSAATVLTAAAGARRTASAVDRLLETTLPSDVVVYGVVEDLDWAPVRALPEVAALATVVEDYLVVDGTFDIGGLPTQPSDAELLRSIERPVVLAGRLADPARVDEVVVTQAFVDTDGRGVGDTVTLGLYAMPTVDTLLATLAEPTGPPDGPVVDARIVGVVRSLWFSDPIGGAGLVVPTVGLYERYRPHLIGTVRAAAVGPEGGVNGPALVRLHRGEADIPAFRAGLAAVTGRADLGVGSTRERADDARASAAFEAAFLAAFGIAALLVAAVLVGGAVTRYAAATAADLESLRGAGLTPRHQVVLAAACPTAAALAGALLGAAAAVPASALLPIGTAALYEPDPGPTVDGWVLGIGILAVPALVAALAGAVAAWRARAARPTGARSAVVTACTRTGLPVPVVVGTRFALESGQGPTAVPTRPALVGAISGVLGVLAALTVSAGVADATANPERFGQNYDGAVYLGTGGRELLPAQESIAALGAHPDVAGLHVGRYSDGSAGDVPLNVQSYEPVDGPPLPLVLVDGSAPVGADEVVLTTGAARRLDAPPGSSVRLTGDGGDATFRVTGIGFTVEDTGVVVHDNGALVTGPGYDSLFAAYEGFGILYATHPGADPGAVAERLGETLGALPGVGGAANAPVYPQAPPARLGEIRTVAALPVLLAAFLAVLALGAVGHALSTSVRRRGAELAVLRALGMTRAQCRRIVTVQAAVLAGVALLVGVPLGVALGRTLWRLVAEQTPLVHQPAEVGWALLLVVPLALLAAVLLAVLPGRRAARPGVAALLRAG